MREYKSNVLERQAKVKNEKKKTMRGLKEVSRRKTKIEGLPGEEIAKCYGVDH